MEKYANFTQRKTQIRKNCIPLYLPVYGEF